MLMFSSAFWVINTASIRISGDSEAKWRTACSFRKTSDFTATTRGIGINHGFCCDS